MVVRRMFGRSVNSRYKRVPIELQSGIRRPPFDRPYESVPGRACRRVPPPRGKF